MSNYYALSLLSLVDGVTDVRSYGADHPGNPFGTQNAISTDGEATILRANLDLTFDDLIAVEPRLANHKYTNSNRPQYLPEGCETLTKSEAIAIVDVQASSDGASDGWDYLPQGLI